MESPSTSQSGAIVPLPRVPIHVRLATMGDLPWMDALHKRHKKQLGFATREQFEGYIEMGAVLVAEEILSSELRTLKGEESAPANSLPFNIQHSQFSIPRQRLGYCISRDRYLKRDELGVIYHLCIESGKQRGYIGAALVREVFNRSAYGCRLYCCWCAQDLEANHFWESLGFVPIAFRAGSDKRRRVHIFWQKRIDGESDEATERRSDEGNSSITTHQSPAPYWYPFKTDQGAMGADRIVFPIPPGVHWSEVKAVAVPVEATKRRREGFAFTSDEATKGNTGRRKNALPAPSSPSVASSLRRSVASPDKVGILVGGKIRYVARPGYVAPAETRMTKSEVRRKSETPSRKGGGEAGAKRARRVAKAKAAVHIDKKYLAAARELRDRWLEYQSANPEALLTAGKYALTRLVAAGASERRQSLLPGRARAA